MSTPESAVFGRGRAEQQRVVIIGGGPAGYEAALVARQLGALVTLVERTGLGGAAVLTDVVPSKSLVAAVAGKDRSAIPSFAEINAQIRSLATAQSNDIADRLRRDNVTLVHGTGRLLEPGVVEVFPAAPNEPAHRVDADIVLLAVGARPRTLPEAVPDGERILTWTQLYTLEEPPEHLIVVGSGVTGAEFADAYTRVGAKVTLVSSRDRVLPNEDPDAADLIENAFTRRGMTVLSQSRAEAAVRDEDSVTVRLNDGRRVVGSHVLLAVGSVPNTDGLGVEESGVALSPSGHIAVDRVSRTTTRGVYAAGDCTGVHPLASVAAMQGRIAMYHALGDAVRPLQPHLVSAAIFTTPEIATVGLSQEEVDAEGVRGTSIMVPLARNARAKMMGVEDGFIKLFAQTGSGAILGAVVVAPNASELIFPIAVALENRLTVDQLAQTYTVYPSLSGSLAEAARMLHGQAAGLL